MAAAVLRRNFADDTKSSRAVVLGSVYSIAVADVLATFSNAEFIVSATKWIAKDEAVNLSILSKAANRMSLRITSQAEVYTLIGLSVLLLPLVIFIVGMVLTLRRRHL
jgi:hypothetical protein